MPPAAMNTLEVSRHHSARAIRRSSPTTSSKLGASLVSLSRIGAVRDDEDIACCDEEQVSLDEVGREQGADEAEFSINWRPGGKVDLPGNQMPCPA